MYNSFPEASAMFSVTAALFYIPTQVGTSVHPGSSKTHTISNISTYMHFQQDVLTWFLFLLHDDEEKTMHRMQLKILILIFLF